MYFAGIRHKKTEETEKFCQKRRDSKYLSLINLKQPWFQSYLTTLFQLSNII
jgi:hypothetical protein